jgi:catechol 2,3-dioxygenase-like lactoylglutathione lyase family enzyme
MPAGGEAAATAFYAGILGFTEVPKPIPLAARGGCWFESGAASLHLGVEADFRPARKAHPALRIDDLPTFAARLEAAGVAVAWDRELPQVLRCNIDDPFGNRIELVQD